MVKIIVSQFGLVFGVLLLVLSILGQIDFANLTFSQNALLGTSREFVQIQGELGNQNPDGIFFNPLKHVIRNAISSGVPAETIVLLLLLPLVASFIAGSRHLIGIRGFGIFLPSALAASFVEIGPLAGIFLFLVIVSIATLMRIFLRKVKFRLQYLPRMALILWTTVLCVLALFVLVPKFTNNPEIASVSIFPVLILILLSEDFIRVQLGKSLRSAVMLTSETLILSLFAYSFFESKFLQGFALLNPEVFLILIFAFNIFLGRYSGLRLREVWRFRRLLKA